MSGHASSNSSGPAVSIGIPVFNGERFIARTLEMLGRQTCVDYELIIVDNGSTDRTGAICADFARRDARIRYLRHEQTILMVDNFWRAFQYARGTYFLWNAADDERPADAIERALGAFAARPDAVMVHGPVDLDVVRDGRQVTIGNQMSTGAATVRERVTALTSGLRHNGMLYGVYRRDALARVRFRQHAGQDFLVCLQMAVTGPIAYVEAPLVRYRHVYGPLDDPMYERRPVSVKELLAYWGHRRNKAWTVWLKGTSYLLRVRMTPLSDRVTAAIAFIVAFGRRYRRHLATETLFCLTLPLAWALRPLIQARRRWRHRAGAGLSIG